MVLVFQKITFLKTTKVEILKSGEAPLPVGKRNPFRFLSEAQKVAPWTAIVGKRAPTLTANS